MFNRFSALWLVIGLIGGYALSGSSATAQRSDDLYISALNPGNTVQLVFERGAVSTDNSTLNCTVGEVIGRWIRCKSEDSFQEDREQRWYSLERVARITKREK